LTYCIDCRRLTEELEQANAALKDISNAAIGYGEIVPFLIQRMLELHAEAIAAAKDETLSFESAAQRIAGLSEELKRARKWILDTENEEASVCPEDVGFVEFIHTLQAELKQTKADHDTLRTLSNVTLKGELEALAELRESEAQLAEARRQHSVLLISWEKLKATRNAQAVQLAESRSRITELEEALRKADERDSPVGLMLQLAEALKALEEIRDGKPGFPSWLADVALSRLAPDHANKLAEAVREVISSEREWDRLTAIPEAMALDIFKAHDKWKNATRALAALWGSRLP
jgi:chromosome segregation ATPase